MQAALAAVWTAFIKRQGLEDSDSLGMSVCPCSHQGGGAPALSARKRDSQSGPASHGLQ